MAEFEVKPGGFKLGKKSIITLVLIVLAVLFLYSSVYEVNPEEEAVILRFGKYIRTEQPGLNFKMPFGIEEKYIVPTKKIFKEEFGFRTIQPGVQTQYSTQGYTSESRMLTGDLNIVDVHWIIQYRIQNPVFFLFKLRNIQETLRNISESITREVVGDHSGDEVIILKRKDIAITVQDSMQAILDNYETGIQLVTVNLQNVNPPQKVKPSFEEVNSARQEKERIVNEAWQQYNKVIPEAEGKAQRTILEAEGYEHNRTNRARGDANRFTQVLKEYRLAKDVTRRRLYIETLEEVLPNADRIYITDEELKNLLPLLNLGGGK